MDNFRNFINKTTKKYTDFKAKFVSFKNKILDRIYNTITFIEVKIKRFKVDFDYYFSRILKSLNNLKAKIDVLKQIHFINKAVRLENKLMYVKAKINPL